MQPRVVPALPAQSMDLCETTCDRGVPSSPCFYMTHFKFYISAVFSAEWGVFFFHIHALELVCAGKEDCSTVSNGHHHIPHLETQAALN